MVSTDINIGTTVKLNSGGPDLTVLEIKTIAAVTWLDNKGIAQYHDFDIRVIKEVKVD